MDPLFIDLLTFDPAGAHASALILAQKALRTASCYNGSLDGVFADWSTAGLLTYRKMIACKGKVLRFVNRSPILLVPDNSGPSLFWYGPAMIDGDGSGGNLEHDPAFQPRTSLRLPGGVSLNARKVPFIVMTVGEMKQVSPDCLGAKSRITNRETNQTVDCVVGDVGGEQDDGEISIFAASKVGVPSSPTRGGEKRPIILYEVWPGVAAFLGGVKYPLQGF